MVCAAEDCSKPLRHDNRSGFCSPCQRRGRSRNRFSANLSYRWSLAPEQFEVLRLAGCWLCREPFAADEVPHVEHDHSCCPDQKSCGKCVRGLAHARCNWIAGHSGDSPELLETIARSLRTYRS